MRQAFGRFRTFIPPLLLALATAAASAATLWREGEAPDATTMKRHPWWYDQVRKSELSGGDWLSNFADGHEGAATYEVEIDEAGEYTLWVRANPVKSALSWRLDDGSWQEIDFRGALEVLNIAADGKPDLRFVGWTKVAQVALTPGRHTLGLKAHGDLHNHGGIDAFVLTTEAFTPQGKTKPGETPEAEPAVAEPGCWPFVPPKNAVPDDALLDLRYLNEPVAGQHGFVRLSADGRGFLRGDGAPIRFWSVVTDLYRRSPEEMDLHCRFMAKLGVNMMRLHANLAATGEGSKLGDINEKELDGIFRFVQAAKQNGIYLTISPYWYHHAIPESWTKDLVGYKKGDMPTGALFFNEVYQEAYKGWVRALYTRPNPYTKVPLKDEPAVAIAQIKNEDSLLFYTFDRLPPAQKRALGERFAEWADRKYGNLEAAYAAWDGWRLEQDDPGVPVLGFEITWFMTQELPNGRARRVDDQLQFLAEVQRGFYEDINRFLKEELGCRQLTNAMNWKSADKLKTDDAERWTYLACDVMAVNRYAGGRHKGANSGYRIDPGHKIENRSLLRHPLQLPTNLKQPAGRPFMITESAWVHPNLYQTEGPFLAAAYLSLTGVDSLYWFAQTEATWLLDPRRQWWHVRPGPTGYALHKWSGSVPQQIGMFPANALMFRLGYLKEGAPVVHEHRDLTDIWQREPPVIAETETFDPNRDTRDLRNDADRRDLSRLAFLVGPVEIEFGTGGGGKTRVAELAQFIDPATETVRSNTGEIELNYGHGVCRINAPKAQGVCGFLRDAGGRFELDTIRIESTNSYATVQAVALDDRPLAESRSVLVQVGTVVRLTGWETRAAEVQEKEESWQGEEILATGQPPWQVQATAVSLLVRNPGLARALLLDTAGRAAQDVPVVRKPEGVHVELPPQTMYLILMSEETAR